MARKGTEQRPCIENEMRKGRVTVWLQQLIYEVKFNQLEIGPNFIYYFLSADFSRSLLSQCQPSISFLSLNSDFCYIPTHLLVIFDNGL